MNRKKLIEVALPLEAINKASAREKSIRHGHPSTLHLWWARRPLAAARAVIFAQMVDDPSANPDLFPTEKAQDTERRRLFKIIEDLVQWENTTNEAVLERARAEIWQSWRRACADNADHPRAGELFDRNKLPAFHDPFAGGGALPLEAQRLGLESYASDLNPVAVIINKAMIEIPPKFAGLPPVNPDWVGKPAEQKALTLWKGAQGLAEDVRYYGQWMRDEAEKRIGHLYPKIEITADMANDRPDLKPYVGRKLTVIAWIWTRAVKSPNPAFRHVDVPLASTFVLSSKEDKEAYVQPVIEGDNYRFTVKVGKAPKEAIDGTKLSRANFKCLLSESPISGDYIKDEGKAGRLGERLMAIIAEGKSGRVFIGPSDEQTRIATSETPECEPDLEISGSTQYVGVKPYGMLRFSQIFGRRQLVALNTFSTLAHDAKDLVKTHALNATAANNDPAFADSYAKAVSVFLALAIGRSANYWSGLTAWGGEFIVQTFGRQAYPMIWDHAEANPFSSSTGNWLGAINWIERVVANTLPASGAGIVEQTDAQSQQISAGKVISTDPPYYDNVPYADLSDFFYVWLRRPLRDIYPRLFSTVAVPKAEELVAFTYRHKNGKAGAEAFFLDGMTHAMRRLAEQSRPTYPVTIYYAVRQAETDDDEGTVSTGWDTFLAAVISSGFGISGTWPMRTERSGGFRNSARNSLASSIVLVCRPRPTDAPVATRRDFLSALKTELPSALAHLQAGNIAPVDLAQAAIGPGMAVFTRYAKVVDAEGNAMTVREALALINQVLDEALAEQEGDFDADSRWALTWFEQQGFAEGEYGVAEQLSKSKNTSVSGLVEAGILVSKAGKVRLLKPAELPADWDPITDLRLTAWETVQHLIRILESQGESGAATLVSKLGGRAATARELCYRLYTLCERKKRAAEALSYNALVQSWPEIVRLAREAAAPAATPLQQGLV